MERKTVTHLLPLNRYLCHEVVPKLHMKIKDIIKKDNLFFKKIVLNNLHRDIYGVLSKNNLNYTARVAISFIARLNFIKGAIFDLANSNELYPIAILYRSYIEHFIRYKYIYNRFISEKNDSAAEEYYLFCEFDDLKKYSNSLKKNEKFFFEIANDFDIQMNLKEKIRKLEKYSEVEIKEKSKQFHINNIIEFFINFYRINKDEELSNSIFKKYFYNLLPKYSEYSSYVHGSPSAEFNLISYDLSKDNTKIVDITRSVYNEYADAIYWSYLIAFQFDRNLEKKCIEITKHYPV